MSDDTSGDSSSDPGPEEQAASVRLPMFPLGAVLFPGLTVPLRVFEDRYLALVQHLLAQPDPAERVFGSVAIREGYEVGSRGNQSLHRVGCRLQLTEVEEGDDGTLEVVAVCRDRFRLDSLEVDGPFPVGDGEVLPEPTERVDPEVADHADALFAAYQAVVAEIGGNVVAGAMPGDPTYRSWAMSAVAPLPLPDRQRLLETDSTTERFELLAEFFAAELRAINVIPSLPAVQLNRTGWSPN
ncbi:LON peptidase substrate-binding domain-containing protein [Nocardioides zeae]|uniref:LON peptidase substrate-binding domain-containing protein n=1 Tax=Nocardioides imazamoxiresistens TaxID=3231893 RepID=A0ABU3PU04_9ACTN|nr:LON peptidase substrate-binding domain-containing protein [Nocardioides zeae]MDT9592719.1 LON peptidase substrate-binding domain-containing protein [Nocardioides zeae]